MVKTPKFPKQHHHASSWWWDWLSSESPIIHVFYTWSLIHFASSVTCGVWFTLLPCHISYLSRSGYSERASSDVATLNSSFNLKPYRIPTFAEILWLWQRSFWRWRVFGMRASEVCRRGRTTPRCPSIPRGCRRRRGMWKGRKRRRCFRWLEWRARRARDRWRRPSSGCRGFGRRWLMFWIVGLRSCFILLLLT